MGGHLFIAEGHLPHFACDAWGIPTDAALRVDQSWLGSAPPSIRAQGGRPIALPAEQAARLRDRGVVLWSAWKGQPPHLVDVVREDQGPDWYVRRALRFLDVAAETMHARAASTGRERPLIGLPAFGVREGSDSSEAGGLIDRLVPAIHGWLAQAPTDCDVVLVMRSRAALAAAQRVRARAADEGWWELPGELLRAADALAERAVRRELVLFIGAGVSAGAGLPTWGEMLRQLAARAGIDRELRDAMQSVSYLDQARLIRDAFVDRRRSLGSAIAAMLEHHRRHALAHALLAALPVAEMVTTNYDELLELATAPLTPPTKVLPYDHAAPGARWLLKLHGTVSHPQDIVITREDYLDYPRARGALLGIVQAMLITRHMLFVGFSLDDDDFLRVAHDVRLVTRRSGPGDGERERFGTVVTLHADPVREDLWGRDIDAVVMTDRAVGEGGHAQAARRLEIFLDRLLLSATTAVDYLLDPRMFGALDGDERAVRDALLALQAAASSAPDGAQAWRPVREFLRTCGAWS